MKNCLPWLRLSEKKLFGPVTATKRNPPCHGNLNVFGREVWGEERGDVRCAMRLLMAHTCVMLHLVAHLSIPPPFVLNGWSQVLVSCPRRHLYRRCHRLISDAPPLSPIPPQSVVSYTSYTSDVLPCEKSPLCCRLHLRVSWMPDALLSKTITLSDTNSSFLPSPSSLSLSPPPSRQQGMAALLQVRLRH
jgi:hypothetical protein